MVRLLAPLVLALTLGTAALAAPAWQVRLFWLTPPAQVTVTVAGKPPVRLTAASAPARFEGPLTLLVPGLEPLSLDLPLRISPGARGRLLLTAAIPREEYVTGVLAGESSVFRSPESLQAMAVTARTYALHFAGRHRAEGFDFCDTTHCQDLRLATRTARVRQAVEATESEVLWFRGSPAAAFYSRHCGGVTESGNQPYLPAHPDPWCGPLEWRTELDASALARAGLHPPLTVVERTPTGRAARLRAAGRILSVADFLGLIGEALGWNRVRSPWFTIDNQGIVEGRGAGHGIGLCQSGAAAMGVNGRSYREILSFYFPGTLPGINAQGFPWTLLTGERIHLFTTQPASDGPLVALAGTLLLRAESAAGFPAPPQVRLRVYPTVTAFRDATGEPGSVAASTIAGSAVVRLQPAALLRGRGVLESTLLHEFLHVTLETRTRPGTPDWLREGLAASLAGQSVSPRMAALLARYGRPTVLSWLWQGVPPAATLVR